MLHSHCIEIRDVEQHQLLDIARRSIANGVSAGTSLKPDLGEFGENLRVPSAVFVTLLSTGRLRGCIGSLEAVEPLVLAVAHAAHNAAFHDRRFSALQSEELTEVKIEISILSPMQLVAAASRQELLDALQPGRDGLLLQDRGHRSTFLPKVWQQIPNPNQFLDQLLVKGGLKAGYWSESIRFHRYTTLSFGED